MAVTNYLWDMVNDNVLSETDENGELIAEYTYEPDHFGNLISQGRAGAESFYHFDGQWNTRVLTDESGDVAETCTYTAFGEDVSKAGTTENPYRYAGEKGYYFDEELNDYYVRARTYEPTIGRWLSRDPHSQGICTGYLYAINAPVGLEDPSGQVVIIPTFCTTRLRVEAARHADIGRIECGRTARQRWNFFVGFHPQNAPCNGYFIQKVSVYCRVLECCGELSSTQRFTYYEAWPVIAGQPGSRLQIHGGFTDEARYTPPRSSEGVLDQSGEIRFYCQNAEDDPRHAIGAGVGTGDLSRTWGRNRSYGERPCLITPGRLLSRQFSAPPSPPWEIVPPPTEDPGPDFWRHPPVAGFGQLESPPELGPHEGLPLGSAASRFLSVNWRCCDQPADHIRATAGPTQGHELSWIGLARC